MKNLLQFSLACLITCTLFTNINAQERPLTVTTKTNSNRSVDFNANKTDPGYYTVVLKLNNLNNASASTQQTFSINGYSGNFYTLNPINKDQGIGYSYAYSTIRGKLNPKQTSDFVYLLPYKSGTKVRATESGFANAQYFGGTTPEDWKAYRFHTAQEDTITAVRKGTIVEVKDLYKTDSKDGVTYTSKLNSLIIEHVDGTLATYRGFKKGSMMVKVGDVVFPGTSLGVNSKTSATSGFNVSLLIMYLKSADIEGNRDKNIKEEKSLYGFITAKFHTTENPALFLVPQQQYTVAVNPELVQKEMTKKGIKKLKQTVA